MGKKFPIYWKSRREQRLAISTLEAEAISLNEGLEMVLYIKETWDEIISEKGVRVIAKTDIKTLERAIKAAKGVSSRRLRVDIALIKEMLMKLRG